MKGLGGSAYAGSETASMPLNAVVAQAQGEESYAMGARAIKVSL